MHGIVQQNTNLAYYLKQVSFNVNFAANITLTFQTGKHNWTDVMCNNEVELFTVEISHETDGARPRDPTVG